MDGAPAARRALASWREDVLTAASGWCAPSETRFALAEAHAVVGVPAWWRDESPSEAREREIRERWRAEDAWLAAQLALARTVPEEITWSGLVL